MGNKIIKNLISYIILASLFITGSGWPSGGFSIYWYYPFYILFGIYGLLAFHSVHKKIGIACLCVTVYALVTNQFGSEGLMHSVKQIANLLIHTFVFYTFLQHEEFKYEAIFRKYISVCKIVLLLGFIQVALWESGYAEWFTGVFSFLKESNISTRFQSVTQEPSFIGLLFVPVILLSIRNLFSREKLLIGTGWSVLFILAYLLTFSLIAYIGLVIALLIFHFKKMPWQKVFTSTVVVTLIFAFTFIAYYFIPFLKLRIDDSIAGISTDFTKEEVFTTSNLSTYAVLSNWHITQNSLKDNPLFGVGLGSYSLAYDLYIPENMRSYSELNKQDGSSMALRLLTETGIIGMAIFLFFTARYKVKFNSSFSHAAEILWIMNAGIFVMIILFLLRNGNYTVNGKILFLLLYYFTYQKAQDLKRTMNDAQFI